MGHTVQLIEQRIIFTIDVPCGCCNSISVENVAASVEAGYEIAPIDVQNATLSVTRTA